MTHVKEKDARMLPAVCQVQALRPWSLPLEKLCPQALQGVAKLWEAPEPEALVRPDPTQS